MADRFFGLDRGSNLATDVSEGAGSPAKNVEVVVDDAVNLTKKDVERLLALIAKHIRDTNTTIPSV